MGKEWIVYIVELVKISLMEKEEKTKVIIDYDKYQELLAKANQHEKYIEDIKSKFSIKHENEIRDLERQIHQAFNEGLDAGISMSYSDTARTIRKDLLEYLDSILENVPALSFWSYVTGEANSLFCTRVREGIDEAINNSIRNICRK